MARTKSAGVNVEEAVTPIKNIEVPKEVIPVEKTKFEPINNSKKFIITNQNVQMHTKPDLLQTSVSKTMTLGTLYEVIGEVKNIYGAFYKLNNGMYVSRSDNFTIC